MKRVIRWCARNAVRLIVAVVLLLGLCAAVLWFAPFSSEYINQRVKKSFEEATGLELRFDALVFYLAQERVILRQVAVVDPATGDTLTGAARLEAELNIDWTEQKVEGVQSFRVRKPAQLAFVRTSSGIQPSESLARLTQIRGADPSGDEPSIAIQNTSITEASIVLNDAQGQPIAQVDEAQLIGAWYGQEDFTFLAKGMLKALDAEDFTPWGGKITRGGESGGIDFFTQVDDLHAETQFRVEMPLVLAGQNISLGGTFFPPQAQGEAFRANVQLSADNLAARDRGSGRTLRASQLHLDAAAAFDPTRQNLRLERLDASTLGFEVAGAGEVELNAPYPYEATIEELVLPESSMRRVQDFLPALRDAVDYRAGRAVLSGQVAGSLERPMPEQLHGTLALEDVELGVAALPFPLRNLSGTLSLQGNELRAPDLSGDFGRSRVQLAGRLTSEEPDGLLHLNPDDLSLQWRLEGHSDDLLSLVTHVEPRAIAGLSTAGSIFSTGTLTTYFGDPPTTQTAARNLVVDGSVRLSEFSIDHPRLPGPVSGVTGRIDVQNDRLVLENMRGELLQSSATFSGSIQGESYFWANPAVNLAIQTDLDLAQVAQQVRPRVEDRFTLPPLEGQATADFQIRGDLLRPQSLFYTGQLELKGVETELDYPALHGAIRDLSGVLTVERDRLAFEDVRFGIGDVDYALDGEWLRAEMRLALGIDGPMEQVKTAQSPLFDIYKVGGRMDLDDTIHLVLPEPHYEKAQADERFPPIYSFIEGAAAVRRESFDTIGALGTLIRDQQGTWVFEDAAFTHLSFPQDIVNLNGTLRMVPEGVRGQSLKATIGGNPAEIDMAVIFNEDGHKVMNYALRLPRADLTPWYGKWKEVPARFKSSPPPPGTTPRLKSVTNVEVHTGPAKVHNFRFSRHDADLRYENWRGGNKLLYLEQLSAQGYGGEATGQGKLTFVRGGPVQWDTSIQTRRVDLETFISGVFEAEPFMGGAMNLRMQLAGTALDKDSMTGGGRLDVDNPQLQRGNAVVVRFVQLVKVFQLSDMVFPNAGGDFTIGGGFVSTDRIAMGNDVLGGVVRGRVGLDLFLDLEVYLVPLSVMNRIPLVDRTVGRLFDMVSSSLLKFRIRGPAQEPDVTPIPVAADKIDDLVGLFDFWNGDED